MAIDTNLKDSSSLPVQFSDPNECKTIGYAIDLLHVRHASVNKGRTGIQRNRTLIVINRNACFFTLDAFFSGFNLVVELRSGLLPTIWEYP